MKAVWKYSILSVCALIGVAYLVFGVVMSRRTTPTPTCNELCVYFQDADERQYVHVDELARLLQQKGLYPVGKKSTAHQLQEIEKTMRQHPMVRTAECYRTIQGNVCVLLTQRVPLVRVVTSGETYFIDTDRKVMPVRESVTTRVLPITGDVSRRAAASELSDFAEWLAQDKFWSTRIARLHVVRPSMIWLIQGDGAAEIVLGELSDYKKKLHKLRHWYEAGQEWPLDQYQRLDVRFRGQVVGVKS